MAYLLPHTHETKFSSDLCLPVTAELTKLVLIMAKNIIYIHKMVEYCLNEVKFLSSTIPMTGNASEIKGGQSSTNRKSKRHSGQLCACVWLYMYPWQQLINNVIITDRQQSSSRFTTKLGQTRESCLLSMMHRYAIKSSAY